MSAEARSGHGEGRIYRNAGNELVLSLIPDDAVRILDVGCGAGDNARRLMALLPERSITGLTYSPEEAVLARAHCAEVLVADLNDGAPPGLAGSFDVLLFSHVLEHIADPVRVLRDLLPFLRPGGAIVIAVPNVLEWRTRMKFLCGHFDYGDSGILDRTHLRFFTHRTFAKELIAPLPELRIERIEGHGSFPLGPLRHFLLSARMKAAIDAHAVRIWPNLFASEVGLLAREALDGA